MPKGRPSTIVLICIALVLAVAAAAYFLRNAGTDTGGSGYPTRDLRVNGRTVALQVAGTDATRELGLSNRPSMPRDEGMVFPYPQPQRLCFWMKDMRFPLDMIWLDSERRVVRVAESVKPESYPDPYCSPDDKPAQYVIELNSGQAKDFGIRDGMQLSF